MLEIKDLHTRFTGPHGEIVPLDGVSLQVRGGDFVAVSGASGCGKTTLLLAAGGLLAPDSGEVLVDGQNPYRLSADNRARLRAENVGFIFQRFHLVPYLSVLDNVLAATLAARPANGSLERAKELIAHFRLSERMGHVSGALSTGERQRTALARALMNDPQLLLADEPTGNLDADNAVRVLDGLRDFARDGGAVLLVTHDDSATARADRVLLLEGGAVG